MCTEQQTKEKELFSTNRASNEAFLFQILIRQSCGVFQVSL